RGAPGRAGSPRRHGSMEPRPTRPAGRPRRSSGSAGGSPRSPAPARASLDVLHLLAELLHLRLLAEHQVRDLAVTRLGAGGIELALELLEQELDPLADRAALAERRSEEHTSELQSPVVISYA